MSLISVIDIGIDVAKYICAICGLQNGLKRLFCITIEAGIDIDVKIFQNFMILMSYMVQHVISRFLARDSF